MQGVVVGRRKTVEALTLDAWLETHADLGFLESIDYLHAATSTHADDIFKDFSFCVKPKVIWSFFMRDPEMLIDIFRTHGYAVYTSFHLTAVLEVS